MIAERHLAKRAMPRLSRPGAPAQPVITFVAGAAQASASVDFITEKLP